VKYQPTFAGQGPVWNFATRIEAACARMQLRNFIGEVVLQMTTRLRLALHEKQYFGRIILCELGQQDQVYESMFNEAGINGVYYVGFDAIPRVVKTWAGLNLVAILNTDVSVNLDMPLPGLVFGFLSRTVPAAKMIQLIETNKEVKMAVLVMNEGEVEKVRGFKVIAFVQIPQYGFISEARMEYAKYERLELVVMVREEIMKTVKTLPKPTVVGASKAVPADSPRKQLAGKPASSSSVQSGSTEKRRKVSFADKDGDDIQTLEQMSVEELKKKVKLQEKIKRENEDKAVMEEKKKLIEQYRSIRDSNANRGGGKVSRHCRRPKEGSIGYPCCPPAFNIPSLGLPRCR
jgi:hypothetical protein